MELLIYMVLFQLLSFGITFLIKVIGATIRPIYSIMASLEKIGVIFHELMHYFSMKLLWLPVKFQDLKINSDGSGSLKIPLNTNASFIKYAFAGISPLFGGTLFILYCWNYEGLSRGIFWEFLKIILSLAIILVISPSKEDYRLIQKIILNRPYTFFKQFFLLSLSIGIYFLNYNYFRLVWIPIKFLEEFLIIIAIYGVFEINWFIIGKIKLKIKNSTQTNTHFSGQRALLPCIKLPIKSENKEIFKQKSKTDMKNARNMNQESKFEKKSLIRGVDNGELEIPWDDPTNTEKRTNPESDDKDLLIFNEYLGSELELHPIDIESKKQNQKSHSLIKKIKSWEVHT